MNSLDMNPSRDRRKVRAAVLQWVYNVAERPQQGSRATLWSGSLGEVREGLREATDAVDALPTSDAGTRRALDDARSDLKRRGYALTLHGNGTVSVRSTGRGPRKARVALAPLTVKEASRQVGKDKLKTHPKMWQTAAKWGGR